MVAKITTTSQVTSSDGKIKVNSSGPLALAKALKTSQQLYSASRIDSKYKAVLTSLAGRLNSQIEHIVRLITESSALKKKFKPIVTKLTSLH